MKKGKRAGDFSTGERVRIPPPAPKKINSFGVLPPFPALK
jgi:hypothetical protein